MSNPKNIGLAAFVGFVFSFLVGIFSGIGFGHVLLRALFSALVFALVYVGGAVLFRLFLSDSSDSAFDSSVQDAGSGEHGSGGLVNITIDDDTLADGAGEPKFAVENAQALQPEKKVADARGPEPAAAESPEAKKAEAAAAPVQVSPEEVVPEAENTATAFKPVPLVGDAAVKTGDSPSPEKAAAGTKADAGKPVLDELPDIGGALPAVGKSSGEETIRDSDFATGREEAPVNLGAASRANAPAPESQNAAVMAQAIQTLLAKDN